MRIHCFTGSYRFLVEATVDQTQKRIPIWTKQYFNNDADRALELLPDIIAADPTNGKYSEWLIKQWRDETARFPEDTEKLSNSLTVFHAKKTRLQEKDINRYTPDSLAIALDQELGLTQKELKAAQHGKLVLPPGAKLVLESGAYQFVKVSTAEAVTQLASRTSWCVANKANAEDYLAKGPLYLVYEGGARKILISFEKNEFKNVKNREVPVKVKFKIVDLLAPVSGVHKESNPALAYQYARDVIKGEWPEGEKALAESPWYAIRYACDVIKGRFLKGESAIGADPESTYLYAEMLYLKRTLRYDKENYLWPEGEKILSQNPKYAFRYAKKVIEGRWPEGEKAISTDADSACRYASDIIGGRWPEGEEAISTDADSAYMYAVLLKKKGVMNRWPEGEEAISTNPMFALKYARDVVGGRWPEGEEAISKDPTWAKGYAKHVVLGEWPEGEEAISQRSYLSYEYASEVLKRRFPKGEKAILSSGSDTIHLYARDVIKGRWPEGEKVIFDYAIATKNSYGVYRYALEVVKAFTGERWLEVEQIIIKDLDFAVDYARYVIEGRWPEAEKTISKNREYANEYKDFLSSLK
jgi:hypothetical protein